MHGCVRGVVGGWREGGGGEGEERLWRDEGGRGLTIALAPLFTRDSLFPLSLTKQD